MIVYRRACQKEDWPKHKTSCGKEKVMKHLRGTIRDPLWRFPKIPDQFRDALTFDGNGFAINSLGFATPHPLRPHNSALQHQLSLLTADKSADYFLFDEAGHAVRFAIEDTFTRTCFRVIRSNAMSTAEQKGLEVLVEYLIKTMEHKPGLSRERILVQLSGEFGEAIVEKMATFRADAAASGDDMTFLEVMSRDMRASSSLRSLVESAERWKIKLN